MSFYELEHELKTGRTPETGFRHPVPAKPGADEQTVDEMIAALKGAAPQNVGRVH